MKQLDILAIGETLVDLISDTEQATLGEASKFTMYPGGEVTNVALNVARLQGSSALVARCGDDTFGAYLRHHLEAGGVATDHLLKTSHLPTTMVVVTRNRATPDFAVYRGADAQLSSEDMPHALLSMTSIVHTSAFALSREPTRATIIDFIKQARAAGCLISFDPNYHPRVWKAEENPLGIFERFLPDVSLIKPSLDDCMRIFGVKQSPETYASRFLALGAQNVVLTLGAEGALVANAEGTAHYPTHQVEVVDVTGAGDAFWAGMLLAWLDGHKLGDAARVGQAVAEIKVQQVGPLTQNIERSTLYTMLGLEAYQEYNVG